MTKPQLAALECYIAAVVRMMTEHGEHASNVRLMLDAKKRLEAAFGQKLPTDYVDLLDTPALSELPNIL